MRMTTMKPTSKLDKEISSIVSKLPDVRDALDSVVREGGVLSKPMTFAEFLADKLLIISVIRNGVPYSLFDVIRSYTPFTEDDWAGFLDLSRKSLQRYKQSSKAFRPIQSEKIIEMSEVTSVGLDVFGDTIKFKLWLDTPNFALGKLKPIELLKDSYGKEMVIGELISISYGILA
jgi:putative toxin-antitoxin system antitoxin component (TIGR02293 family)